MKKLFILAAIALPLLVFAEEETIGYLGVITEELSETMMKALDVEYGLLIKDVVENAPAEKAGLEDGDGRREPAMGAVVGPDPGKDKVGRRYEGGQEQQTGEWAPGDSHGCAPGRCGDRGTIAVRQGL